MTCRRAAAGWVFLVTLQVALPSSAHEVRPAYLELRQVGADTYDVLWKVPSRGDLRLGLYARLSAAAVEVVAPRARFVDDAYVERWRVRYDGGLAGTTIRIEGLESTSTDVLVRIENSDGTSLATRLLPDAPAFVVPATASPLHVASTYLRLGTEHILLGVDHLLFVLALLFLLQGWRQVVGTITAFTVAHTMTLAAATLGYVHVPTKPVEACIALSIVFVAGEIVHGRRGAAGVTARWPWVVAFTFGLLHGLGFAGALSEVGLPPTAIPLALLCFNIGVEIGQLLFVALAATLLFLWHRAASGSATAARIDLSAAYAIGSVAAYWTIERTLAFWS